MLRLTEEGDAEHIVGWRNQPETARWLNQTEPLTVEQHLSWFHGAHERGDLLLAFDSLDGEPVGCCSVFDFDRPGTTAEWGRLFVSRVGGGSSRTLEGCYLVHRLCFDALRFHRLFGRVWADNDRAWRLYQFLGWVKEGVRRKHWLGADGYHDVFVIGVFPEEFAAQRRAVESKLYGSESPPVLTEEDGRRLRGIVGARIHRALDADRDR